LDKNPRKIQSQFRPVARLFPPVAVHSPGALRSGP
jgi:hypothetical protein